MFAVQTFLNRNHNPPTLSRSVAPKDVVVVQKKFAIFDRLVTRSQPCFGAYDDVSPGFSCEVCQLNGFVPKTLKIDNEKSEGLRIWIFGVFGKSAT